MSTGVNLGFPAPVVFVDVDNHAWFTGLVGVPGVIDAIDASKVADARGLVVNGVKAAIATGVDASSLVVLLPSAAGDLASAARGLGVLAPPNLVYADAATPDLAAAADDAHVRGAKFVCELSVSTATNVAAMQAAGVEADAWIVPTADDAALAQAHAGGRSNVALIGRDRDLVAEDAYGDTLRAWLSGAIDAGVAADQIGAAISAAAGGQPKR